jgi:hypothetical protein
MGGYIQLFSYNKTNSVHFLIIWEGSLLRYTGQINWENHILDIKIHGNSFDKKSKIQYET